MFDQGVVGLEPLGAMSAGEGQLVVSFLAVTHDIFRAYFSQATVGTKVDPVLGNWQEIPIIYITIYTWGFPLKEVSCQMVM